MHRIDGAGHVGNLFVTEDPAMNRPPTEVTAEILNAFQEEIAAVIEWRGVALDKLNNAQLRDVIKSLIGGYGQCELSLVGANLKLLPKNGNKLMIAGRLEDVPAAGVSLAPAGLTPSTLYYIYAYMNAGEMIMEVTD